MEDCIALARVLGERVGGELKIPVYLYERAATTPTRENLADVRRGEFEGLRDELGKNPARNPDFGPSQIHPTCGAIAIGARPVPPGAKTPHLPPPPPPTPHNSPP